MMMNIQTVGSGPILLDMYVTAGVGVLALMLGMALTKNIPVLKKMCIPSPVSGGIVVSLLTLVLYLATGIEFTFDGTIKDVCMMLFFTSVGYQCNLKVLKSGGRSLVTLVLIVAFIIIVQNSLGVGIAKLLGVSPLLGIATGSIPMTGGHGTAGGFSPLLEQLGLQGASSITMAAATFGLVAGSLIGGPVAEMLIKRHKLADAAESQDDVMTGIEASDASPESREEKIQSDESSFRKLTRATYQLLLAMAAGTLVSKALALTGVTFPTYFGTLVTAAIVRNVCEFVPGWSRTICIDRIISVGNICLSLFLGMAMISLKLWELSSLALPLCLILVSQALFLALIAVFVAYPLLGKSYDSAVFVSGLCGFALGATPNAMANMSAVCFKYRYAVKPFLFIPIVGAMFADIINTTVIAAFINLFC